MKVAVCEHCKRKNAEGVICRHCGTTYCYECFDLYPPEMRTCPICGQFLCKECYNGMVKCDFSPSPEENCT